MEPGRMRTAVHRIVVDLTNEQEFLVPGYLRALKVAEARERITRGGTPKLEIWYEAQIPADEMDKAKFADFDDRRIRVFVEGTGFPFDHHPGRDFNVKYLDSVLMEPDGQFVWHVYVQQLVAGGIK